MPTVRASALLSHTSSNEVLFVKQKISQETKFPAFFRYFVVNKSVLIHCDRKLEISSLFCFKQLKRRDMWRCDSVMLYRSIFRPNYPFVALDHNDYSMRVYCPILWLTCISLLLYCITCSPRTSPSICLPRCVCVHLHIVTLSNKVSL